MQCECRPVQEEKAGKVVFSCKKERKRGKMMDKIKIKDLEVYANHGVFPEETKLGQKFLVSADLYTDVRKAGCTDELEESTDYGAVCHFITEYLQKHTWKLIESVAENLTREMLLTYPLIREAEIEIKKPWAPIGLPLQSVSVTVRRSWHEVYVAMGSNLGDKQKHLEDAVKALDELEDCKVEKVSDFIRTEPYGVTDQDEFLNGCLCLKTLKTPLELLETLHDLEKAAKRERIRHWGPRTLDLDILFYDDIICQEPELCIPHVDMQNRDFVLKPLKQIAPYKRHPGTLKTVTEMEQDLEERVN